MKAYFGRDLWFLWLGQLVSQTGDAIFEIALLWGMLELTGSPTATGLAAMATYLPALLFGLFAGALVDRFDRRRVMLFADAVRAALALAAAALFLSGMLSAFSLGLFAFAIATFSALFNPARDALVPQLVRQDQLVAANSLIQTSWQFSHLLGPALAGWIIAWVGLGHLFTADGVSFLISFAVLGALRGGRAGARSSGVGPALVGAFADLREGLRYVRSDRRIGVLLAITALDNLLMMGPAIVGVPIFVKDVLGLGASAYAWIQVTFAVGMIVGTVLLNTAWRGAKPRYLLAAGIVLDGLTLLPLAWISTLGVSALTLFAHALATPVIVITRVTLIQRLVPEAMRGRVFAMFGVAVTGFSALSMAVTGIAAEKLGIGAVFGAIALPAAATGALIWSRSELDEGSEMSH